MRQSWQDWAVLGAKLAEDEWARPTRLTGWDVRTLYAHVARSAGVLAGVLREPSDAEPERRSAAAYFASFRAVREEAARSVDAAARQAAAAEPARIVGWLAEDGPRVLAEAEAAGAVTITTLAGTIALPDYLLTRLVEATVHLLDLRDAVPGPGPDPAAVDRVADVLVGIAGPVAFVEAATGRADLPGFPLLA
ncbi:maleylpyruvate isomerase N-terminal domain-containing protein [Actinophytocola sp.]|uniref:maleylpyruvate isomerase N-terminal domain-containing protein n=1 Tax=Actinophytocola sp. TaxID=1872138 RepID=UPI002EDABFA8